MCDCPEHVAMNLGPTREGSVNYQKAKRQLRTTIALKEHRRRGGEDEWANSLNCKGWRLTDGKEYPVTVTRIPTKENDDD